jgi:hypothetical protein
VFGEAPAFVQAPPVGGVGIERPAAGPFALEEPAAAGGGFEFEPLTSLRPGGETPGPPSSDAIAQAPAAEAPFDMPPLAAAPVPPIEVEAPQPAPFESPVEPVAEQQPVLEFALPAAAEPTVGAGVPADEHLFTAPPGEEAPALLKAVLTATAAKAATAPVQPPASLTLARLYVQQQALAEAVIVLERLLEREPANIEAQDLLALVRDMMTPLPEAPPPLSTRERKIAALQRWLASLTLGRERAAR